jgi:prepilin-type N-terminal cleavage/methylation domain-containing protein
MRLLPSPIATARPAPTPRPRRRPSRAFTLMETMVAVAILAVGSLVMYDMGRATLFLTAKNSSLNVGNADLRHAYYRLLSTLEAAPIIVDCANFDPVAKTFTAVASGTWGNSVRFMIPLPVSCYILPVDGSGYTPTNPPPPTRSVSYPVGQTSVSIWYSSSIYPTPVISASARFYPEYPHVSETLSTGTSPGVKPGLGMSAWSIPSANHIAANFNNTLTATSTFLDCNRAYILVEGAFAVVPNTGIGTNKLLYFADTSQTSSPLVLCQDLDTGAQTQANDTTIPSGGTTGTFCVITGVNGVQTLLPIRAPQFTNIISKVGGSAANNNTWLNVNAKFRERIFF